MVPIKFFDKNTEEASLFRLISKKSGHFNDEPRQQ